MATDSMAIASTSNQPPRVHLNSNYFNNYNAVQNYNHISLPADTDSGTIQMIGDAGLGNYMNFSTTGLNAITQESGTLDGGVNFQPTSSFKHRIFYEENGYYPPSEKGWVA